VVILVVIPKLRGLTALNTKNWLRFIVLFQYVPRFLRIQPLYKEVTKTSGILTETAWAGAAFNLFMYMLASHVSFDSTDAYPQSNTVRLEEMRVKRQDEKHGCHTVYSPRTRERTDEAVPMFEKWMSNYWMQCVIVSSLHSTLKKAILSVKETQLMRCSSSCVASY
ncbi:hypothetical protein IFM89_025755, partial [Coptis chinensis]